MARIKYSDFSDRLDVGAIEDAIGFEVLETDFNGNDVGHCLFPQNHSHGDTTGKFAIHPEGKVYNCWVCGGGSLLSLIMELYDLDSESAEDWLRPYAVGDERGDTEFVDDFLNLFAADSEKRGTSLPYFNPRVLRQWGVATHLDLGVEIEDGVIEMYGVRCVPNLRKPAPKKGRYADDEDYEGPALVWPHFWYDRLVGWQARWLNEDRPEWVAKWTNTTDFPKNSTLYGWNFSYTEPLVYVVESAKTVLKLRDAGLNAVGTFGSSINDPQMRLLRRFQEGVVLCPDNDNAGAKWMADLMKYLERFVPLYACFTPNGEGRSDLADMPGNIREYVDNMTVSFEADPFM